MIAKRTERGNASARNPRRRFNYLPTELARLDDLTGMAVDVPRDKRIRQTNPPVRWPVFCDEVAV